MKVLIVTDVWGWAFAFVARGIKKYSSHDVDVQAWYATGGIDFMKYDCIFFMNKSCFYALPQNRRKQINTGIKNKCVGIRSGLPLMQCDYPILNWKNGCVQHKAFNYLKSKYPDSRFFLCRNGVDTDIFKPVERPENRFVIGWAGNPAQSVKRYYMLSKLDFPLKVKKNWGGGFFHKNRSRKEMVDFYGSIDTYVCTSITEGMPQPILEAGASGLPIVSTPAGGIDDFVDKEWLVPINPPETTIKEINLKLKMLEQNPKLRVKVGQQNLYKALNEWNWKNRVKEYDRMFEA